MIEKIKKHDMKAWYEHGWNNDENNARPFGNVPAGNRSE
jgi:hypothetical protein